MALKDYPGISAGSPVRMALDAHARVSALEDLLTDLYRVNPRPRRSGFLSEVITGTSTGLRAPIPKPSDAWSREP